MAATGSESVVVNLIQLGAPKAQGTCVKPARMQDLVF